MWRRRRVIFFPRAAAVACCVLGGGRSVGALQAFRARPASSVACAAEPDFALKESTPFDVGEHDEGVRSAKFLDWDAHLYALEREKEAEAAAEVEEERMLLAGGDEWFPAEGEEGVIAKVLDDSEPESFKTRWDDVDPSVTSYRNPARSKGATWSRIRLKEDWWQFDENERLKTEEGWDRFDHRGFTVSEGLFKRSQSTVYGALDLVVVAKLLPTLRVLGDTCQLLEASKGKVRFKYWGPASHRIGIEAYAKGMILETYPDLTDLTFDAVAVKDHLDS